MASKRQREPQDTNRDAKDEKRLVGRDDKGQYDKRSRPPAPKKK